MPFPEYQDIEDPLLCEIYSSGGSVRARDTYKPLADYFSLTPAERRMTRDEVHHDGKDEPHWNNMVQWARRKLKERGYLAHAGFGIWQLSEEGVRAAERVCKAKKA